MIRHAMRPPIKPGSADECSQRAACDLCVVGNR